MFSADEQLSTNPAIFYNPTHGVGSCSSSEVSSLRFSSTSGHLNHHRYEMTTDCLFDPTWMPTAADALMYQNFSHHQSLPTNPAAASLFDSMSMKSLIPAYSSTVSLPYGPTESKPARSSIPTNHTSSSALKMFRCVTCGKEYCRKSTLKAHMKHHIGDRPFSCQVNYGWGFHHRSTNYDAVRASEAVQTAQINRSKFTQTMWHYTWAGVGQKYFRKNVYFSTKIGY